MWSMIEYDGAEFARMPVEVSEQSVRREQGTPVCLIDTYTQPGGSIFRHAGADFTGAKVAVVMCAHRPMAACLVAGQSVREACYLQHDCAEKSVPIAEQMHRYVWRNNISVGNRSRAGNQKRVQGLYVLGLVATRQGIIPASDVSEELIAKEGVSPQTVSFIRAFQEQARQRS